jgi:hypothetical protein
MSHEPDFDVRLAAHFEREQSHVPADDFVAATMRKVRAERRGRDVARIGLRVAVLVAAVMASPWLIAGVARFNAALGALLSTPAGQLGTWLLGALAVLVVLARRARSR